MKKCDRLTTAKKISLFFFLVYIISFNTLNGQYPGLPFTGITIISTDNNPHKYDFGSNYTTYNPPSPTAIVAVDEQDCIEYFPSDDNNRHSSDAFSSKSEKLSFSNKSVGPTDPTVTAFAIQPSCNDGLINSDGYLQLSAVIDGDRLNFSTTGTYTGDTDYANAITIGALPFQFNTGLSNPSSSQDYTIRVFNGNSSCFTDVVVTMQEQDCSVGCDCDDFIYLNDDFGTNNQIHKFSIDSSTGGATEIGSPWVDNILNPHGIASDLNGFLYFTELRTGPVRTSRIYKADCDGNILSSTVLEDEITNGDVGVTTNIVSIGNTLYINDSWGGRINAFDICQDTLLGTVSLSDFNLAAWGLALGSDDFIYATTDQRTTQITHQVYKINPDTSNFTTPANNISPLFSFDVSSYPGQSGGSRVAGITIDDQNNIYVVSITPVNQSTTVIKFDQAGNVLGSISDTTSGDTGFFGAIGIAYSSLSGYLYITSNEDCISVVDPVTMSVISPLAVPGGEAKGIAITQECCPTNNNATIDTTLCAANINDVLFLQEIINCEGVICEGLWSEGGSNTGLTYNSCNNSVTIDDAATACGSFTIESDGTGANAQCGAFKITVNIEIGATPEAKVFAIQPSCTNELVNSDGYLQLSEITNGDRVNWSVGNTYTGDTDYANALDVSTVTFPYIITTGLSNPSGTQDYTIRVFDNLPACNGGCTFTDYTVTMQEQDCTVGCNCVDMIYLNEPTNGGSIHKFKAFTGSFILSEILTDGASWYPGTSVSELSSPHGIGIDLNGFIYIGETGPANPASNIRKLTCDGEIFPTSEFAINTQGYNFGTIGNSLFVNRHNTGVIKVFDVCSGLETGEICLEGSFGGGTDTSNWGYYLAPDSTMYATTNFLNAGESRLYKFSAADIGGSCVPILIKEEDNIVNVGDKELFDVNLRGVTTDADNNIYIVERNLSPANSRILKYNSEGEFIKASVTDNVDGDGGYFAATGIIYSPSSNYLYVSSTSAFEDCVAAFDLDLNYVGASVPATGTGTDASKGIALIQECCPTSNNIVIDTTLCAATVNDVLFLQELINCEGSICEGLWTEGGSNTDLIYAPCDNSVTINALTACGSFTLESDGTGTNPQCGAFKITINISVNAVTASTIAGDQSFCQEGDPDAFTITTPATGADLTYQWQSSTTDCTTGFSDIAGAISDTYDPPANLAATTYYKVITNSDNTGCISEVCADTSNCITVTVNPNPTATAAATDVTCLRTSTTPNSDGTITLVGFSATDTYQYSAGSTFNAGTALPAAMTTIPVDGVIVNNLTNPVGTQDYTVRITNATGCFVDRIVTLNEVTCTVLIDYPDYSSSLRSCPDEPCHIISSELYLGQAVSEDATPGTTENADSDDDDGVLIGANMQFSPGSTVRLPVTIYNDTGSPAYLRMWIDWNADGDFDDTNEQVEDSAYPSTGAANVVLVSITIPIDAIQTSLIALRTRLSTDDINSAAPCGTGNCATDGEIEDYLLQVSCPTPICPPAQLMMKSGNP